MKLQAIKIEKSYQSRKVVDGVDLELSQGEIVGLLGPNGAGKTTCFYMIVGLIKSDSGKIMIDTIEVSKEPMYKRAINGIGYLAQEASVFRKLSVEDNIKAVLELGDLTEDEQLIYRGYFEKVFHQDLNTEITYPGAPYQMKKTPWKIMNPKSAPHAVRMHPRQPSPRSRASSTITRVGNFRI